MNLLCELLVMWDNLGDASCAGTDVSFVGGVLTLDGVPCDLSLAALDVARGIV